MHYYSGYTIPLNTSEVFALIEFGSLKRGEVELLESEFILHSYITGEIQYEARIENIIYMFTEDDLQQTLACPSGKFKENDGDILYHLSDTQVRELQTVGLTKLWDQDHDEDLVDIKKFKRYNMGGNNYRYVAWVGDILTYFYQSDMTDIDCH